MYADTGDIRKITTAQPLVRRAEPNFRSKKDKERGKPGRHKKKRAGDREPDLEDGPGDGLDRYV